MIKCKAYLQTKSGEIEGELEVRNINYIKNHWVAYFTPKNRGFSFVSENQVGESVALIAFEESFGRIIREDG